MLKKDSIMLCDFLSSLSLSSKLSVAEGQGYVAASLWHHGTTAAGGRQRAAVSKKPHFHPHHSVNPWRAGLVPGPHAGLELDPGALDPFLLPAKPLPHRLVGPRRQDLFEEATPE